jgi:hypothetical protein
MLLCDMYLTFSNGKYIGGGGFGWHLSMSLDIVCQHPFCISPMVWGASFRRDETSQINDG